MLFSFEEIREFVFGHAGLSKRILASTENFLERPGSRGQNFKLLPDIGFDVHASRGGFGLQSGFSFREIERLRTM